MGIEKEHRQKTEREQWGGRMEVEECGEVVVCDDVTTSPVRIASRVSAKAHSKSRVNAVIKYTCEYIITSKIRAGCEIGRVNILR